MKYKYIQIEQEHDGMWKGWPMFTIRNIKSGAAIGCVSYYPPWKQYVFSSEADCAFNNSCLRDVLDFIDNHAPKARPTNTKGSNT